ncbi:MAG TPA: reverse transcriptase domain-containing protein, partial [Terriglobales bacterium]
MPYKYNCKRQESRVDRVSFTVPGSPLKLDSPLQIEVIDCVRGVLSPLLSNLVLDELDRELERRGHCYVRYADDCNIYVRSEQAGRRVMESITRFITCKLKLKVNETKSAVARPQERKFLGFSFTAGPEVKGVIAPKALDRFQRRIREIRRRAKSVSMATTMAELGPYMRGWRSYFGFCETPEV